MGYPTDRVLMYNTQDEFIGELAPHEVKKRLRVEQINYEHELTIVTTRVLHVGTRLLTVDGTGKWREHVVYRPDEKHESGEHADGTYVCMWSLQYDLTEGYTEEHAEPGMGSSCTAAQALAFAIADSPRWHVGTVDVGSVAAGKGCVMIGVSDWERLKLVVKHWGGEVDAEIAVDGTHVTSRGVALRAHLGSSTVRRRFDWGHDLKSISRAADEGPYFCRVVPLGRGQREYAEDDETEFDWPLDISEETGGRVWIEDEEAALVFRTKNPDGTYHYPTKVVEYDEDDPELLLNRGLEDLPNHTRPGVRYEASVVQLAEAGMDVHGLELGDETQCSDWGFNEDAALKVQGRVTRMEVNELDPSGDTNLTIGELGPSLAHTLYDIVSAATSSLTKRVNHIDGGGTIAYLETLIDQLNEQINATGGYSYIVPNEGLITYDIAVDDPLVGYNSATLTWASQVTQIKGGSIRIANEKNASFAGINDWKWKTLIVAGHIAAELVTAANIVAGYIGSASSGNYWNLDTGELRMAATNVSVENQTLAQYIANNLGLTQSDVFNLLTNNGDIQGLYMSDGQLYINADYIASGYIGDTNGESYWDISDGTIVIVNATKNFNNRNEQFKFGAITFTDSSGWLNTRTGQQRATGIMVGDVADSSVSGRSRVYIIPNLPATSSDSNSSTEAVMIARDALKIMSEYDGSTTRGCISLNSGYVEINQVAGSTVKPGIILGSSGLYLYATRADYTLNNGNTSTSITSSLHLGNDSSVFNTGLTIAGASGLSVQNGPATIGKSGAYKNLTVYGKITSYDGLSVSGSKSRFVDTNNYGNRLLYCYETPSPMFADVGSGMIGEDGVCVVSIDDVFGECARTDMAYQVFLQKCGPGDLWVSEKAPTHFVVEGTPGLAFDWEAKAHQTGFELERLEDMERRDDSDAMGIEDLSPLDAYAEEDTGEQFDPYGDELRYVEEIESLYEELYEEAA